MFEKNRKGEPLTITEDGRGTYILNSKDLNMIEYIGDLIESGVYSFKVEGRMKSPYYVASVINAYRKAIDLYYKDPKNYKPNQEIVNELFKNAHRDYTTGFYFGEKNSVCLETSQPKCDYEFMAEVVGYDDEKGMLIVEMRNRFKVGDTLEVLSNNDAYWNKEITITEMYDEKGRTVEDAKLVQQKLYIKTDMKLTERDILRKRVK